MAKIIKQFAIAYVFLHVVLFIIVVLLEGWLDIDTGPATLFISSMSAGSYVCNKYVKQFKEIPTSSLAWKISFYTLPVIYLVNIFLVSPALLFSPEEALPLTRLSELGGIALLSVIVGALLITSLAHALAVRAGIFIIGKYMVKKSKKSKIRHAFEVSNIRL